MHIGAGCRTGDPLAGAVGGGAAAVERLRPLHGDVRAAEPLHLQPGRQQGGALVGAPAADHVDPGLAQTCGAARRGLAGIGDGEHHARDAGGDERFAAGTGAAGVVARFEGDDGGRAARGIRPAAAARFVSASTSA
jgi:hypothetical protein